MIGVNEYLANPDKFQPKVEAARKVFSAMTDMELVFDVLLDLCQDYQRREIAAGKMFLETRLAIAGEIAERLVKTRIVLPSGVSWNEFREEIPEDEMVHCPCEVQLTGYGEIYRHWEAGHFNVEEK